MARVGEISRGVSGAIAYQLQAAARVRRLADNEPDRVRADRLRVIAADLQGQADALTRRFFRVDCHRREFARPEMRQPAA